MKCPLLIEELVSTDHGPIANFREVYESVCKADRKPCQFLGKDDFCEYTLEILVMTRDLIHNEPEVNKYFGCALKRFRDPPEKAMETPCPKDKSGKCPEYHQEQMDRASSLY